MRQAGVVRIGKHHHQALRQLAERMGESMQTVVEKAIDELKRKQFFEEFNAAYAALRSDPKAWAEELEERQYSAGALTNDEPDEVWSEDGSVVVNG
jgi:hypothetical protein